MCLLQLSLLHFIFYILDFAVNTHAAARQFIEQRDEPSRISEYQLGIKVAFYLMCLLQLSLLHFIFYILDFAVNTHAAAR
jgi:hypothetical protein